MRIQEETFENIVLVVSQILNQIEQSRGVPLQQMWNANELFLYLFQQSHVFQNRSRFREATRRKMNEIFIETERYKTMADLEGIVVDESLVNAANALQNTMIQLRQVM